jgi:hypothetical protein
VIVNRCHAIAPGPLCGLDVLLDVVRHPDLSAWQNSAIALITNRPISPFDPAQSMGSDKGAITVTKFDDSGLFAIDVGLLNQARCDLCHENDVAGGKFHIDVSWAATQRPVGFWIVESRGNRLPSAPGLLRL